MNRRFKISSLALSALLAASFIASCGEAAEKPVQTETASPSGDASDVTETVTETGITLPEGDFGGAEFNLLQYEETSAATSTICVEELNGDMMNDAIYERTQTVEERLNIDIKFVKTGLDNVNKTMKNSVAAGDDIYQAFWQHSTNGVTNFLMQGYLLNQDEIPVLDFSQPWWSKNAINSVKLTDKTYLSFGDINYYLFDFQSILIYNMPIVQNNGMTDPYQLMTDGKWTIDAFLSMVEAAPADLNGDGKLGTKDDLIGFTGFKTATEFAFLHGADVELFSRDSDGMIRYDGVSDKYYEVISKYSNILGQKELAEHNGDYLDRFRSGLTLFTSCSVGALSTMREVEFDYGVVPHPKYDESQADYISFVTNQMQPMMIPITVQDAERCGTVLETMAAASYDQVRDKYFNVLLESKYVRDEKAIETLRMLYAGDARFEIEHVYDWNGVQDKVANAVSGKADKFISDMEKVTPKLEASIQSTIEYLENL